MTGFSTAIPAILAFDHTDRRGWGRKWNDPSQIRSARKRLGLSCADFAAALCLTGKGNT